MPLDLSVLPDSQANAKAAPSASAPEATSPSQDDAPSSDRSLWQGMGDFASAAGHHAAGAFYGAGQLVNHGLDWSAQKLPDNPASRYIHDATQENDAALRKREADYQASTPDNAWSYSGAALGEVAPFMFSGGANALSAIARPGVKAGEWLASKFAPAATSGALSKIAGSGGAGAAKLAGTAAGGAAQGAALGTVAPVADAQDYWGQKIQQMKDAATLGAVLPTGMQAASMAVKAPWNVAKLLVAPKSFVVQDAADKLGPNAAAVAQKLKSAPQLVPGSRPSAAQVGGDNTLIQIEKASRNTPAGAKAFADREGANNAARWQVVNDIAKGEPEIQAAIQDRTAATEPLRNSLFQQPPIPVWKKNISDAGQAVQQILNKPGRMSGADFDMLRQARQWINSAANGGMDSHTLYNNLASLSPGSKAAIAAIQNAGGALQNTGNLVDVASVLSKLDNLQSSSLGTDPVIRKAAKDLASNIQEGVQNTGEGAQLMRPDLLDGYRQNVRNFLRQHASNGAVSSKQEAAFEPMRDAITEAIEKSNAGYKKYLATYAQKSAPINTMEAGQQIVDALGGKAMNAQGEPMISLPGFQSAMKRAVDAQKYGIDPAAQKSLQGVADDLQRASISSSMRSPGSDTAYNLAAPGALGKLLFGSNFQGSPTLARGIGATVGAMTGGYKGAAAGYFAAQKLGEIAGSRAQKQLGELLNDPPTFGSALEEHLAPRSAGPLSKLVGRASQALPYMAARSVPNNQPANP